MRYPSLVCLSSVLCLLVLPPRVRAAGVYEVRTRLDQALCLDVASNLRSDGAEVQLWQCKKTANQTWTFEDEALRVYGASCLDVIGGSRRDGVRLQIWGCKAPNTNQRFERFGNMLRWVGTNLCLDVTDGRAANGTRLQLWTCNATNKNQTFAFVERDAPLEPVPRSGLAAARPAPVPVDAAAAPVPAPVPSRPAANAPVSSVSKLQAAGQSYGYRYIAFAAFLNKHPVLKPLRQDIIDAGMSVQPPLPPVLLAAVAMEESSGNPHVAGGLMQFTWAPTWAYYGRGDILNGRDSLFAAARYLTDLLKENNDDLSRALRAYNGDANPKYVSDIKLWLAGGFPYGEGT